MSDFSIRSYKSADTSAVYEICLKTGNSGQDATHLFSDPLVLGHIYVGPYMEFEPQSVFILEDDQGPCGYIMGVLDSQTYYQWMHSEWLPKIRVDYKKPTGDPDTWNKTEKITNLLFQPELQRLFPGFPAHLHIDLLSRAQGKGQGKLMMDRFIDYLRYNKISGVHLELSSKNDRAFNFYRKYGMQELDRNNESIFMGFYL
ncbi:Acetyltransferase [hydrothermal vent metagenome]|uniref:Acetyltransferase n=1 Tax=hydrothermal vent metagenome TaxID=652676 RepID=A0A170QD83_9ZZZZ